LLRKIVCPYIKGYMLQKTKLYRMFRNPFVYVAFWQMMTFLILILAVWAVEYQEIATVVYKAGEDKPDLLRAIWLTFGIVCIALIIIGHTYLQQKRIINNMLSVCSRCRKVQVNKDYWESMEDYLYDISPSDITHGLCPECLEITLKEIEKKKEKNITTS
jgi:hypothetical protein